MHDNKRDDKIFLENISYTNKFLIGIASYCPFSRMKKAILRLLGAKIGKGVYLGPGVIIVTPDFSNIVIGNDVFIAPDVMIKVDAISIGDQTKIGYQCLLVGKSLSIGKRCIINNRSFIEFTYAPVYIEDDVTIAASVIISSHDGAYRKSLGRQMKASQIIIRDHAFVGNNAIILPGISIGNRSIVGAGAVVTKDVQNDSVVVGVPARIIQK